MKASYLFFLGTISFFFLTSCSQSREIVTSKPQYRYNKVYVGNKIVYRGMDKSTPAPRHLALNNLQKIEPLPPEEPVYMEATPKTDATVLSSSKAQEPKALTKISALFMQQLGEVRHDIKTGNLFNKDKSFDAQAYAEDDRSMQSADEIFAVLGFVFGLASLLNAIWFSAILGVVFSILGWNSEWNVFAVLGLVFSLAGVVLFLI